MNTVDLIRLSLKVSRPRFWFYLAGPFAVGCIYGASSYLELLKPWFFLYFTYFLLLANIFLYGVNDFWDYETDLINPKKDEKEYRVNYRERETLRKINYFIMAINIILLIFQENILQRLIFGSFVFLSYFYSAEPLRFKEKPLLDSASNFLYIIPGIFSYYLASNTMPNYLFLLAGFFHTFAMHLFSAIPDINFDQKTEIITSAVLFGRNLSLILCMFAWSGLAYISIILTDSVFTYLTLIYPVNTIILLVLNIRVQSVYWFYPYINVGLGGLMFLIKAINTPWKS
jgi:4-hydroxybenzoate polyprenyltransferase